MKNIVFIYVLLMLTTVGVFAQNGTITGVVTDANGEVLIGVNIVTENSSGTVSDLEGNYKLDLEPGKHTIKFSFLSFKTSTKRVELKAGETRTINVVMEEDNQQLDIVVVTGSAYEKKMGEEVVSIDVIKPYLVESNNNIDLSQAVEKVPGVNIIDGQATIRGGAGYAYGAGSRVQVLVDEMPLLTGDLQEVRWNFVPMENVEQIEVIKGAASSLYGSSALNGVINIRTGYAYEKPRTKVQVYQGIYSNPKRDELKWWDGQFHPFFTGAFFSHRQRFGNLDVVVGANLNMEKSYLFEGDDQQARLNFKTRWQSKKVKGLSYGVNGNGMYQQFGRFFLWENSNEGAYKPFQGTGSEDYYSYVNIDPHMTYYTENGMKHMLRTRYYNVTRYQNGKQPEGSTNLYYINYQLQKKFKRNWVLTAGAIYNYSHSFSNLYDEKLLNQLGAVYAQGEKKIGKLSLLAGLRYEINALYQRIDSVKIESSDPLVRVGVNYQFGKATYVRASFGQGYRIPSIGERYIEENITESLKIYKNPGLEPESGWTSEIGVKQGFSIGNWNGYGDLALFWTEFTDMIEFTFGRWGNSGDVFQDIGFKSQNISQARVAGYELSLFGDGSIGQVPVRVIGGYTFNYPADIGLDTAQRNVNIYLQNLFQSFSEVDSLLDQQSILKYRLRNVARFDAEFDVRRFTIGGSVNYTGFMERIDEIFDLIPGVTEFRTINNKGIVVFDARLAYKFNDNSTVNVIAKNIENREYSLRPGLLESPRSFTIQYKYSF